MTSITFTCPLQSSMNLLVTRCRPRTMALIRKLRSHWRDWVWGFRNCRIVWIIYCHTLCKLISCIKYCRSRTNHKSLTLRPILCNCFWTRHLSLHKDFPNSKKKKCLLFSNLWLQWQFHSWRKWRHKLIGKEKTNMHLLLHYWLYYREPLLKNSLLNKHNRSCRYSSLYCQKPTSSHCLCMPN